MEEAEVAESRKPLPQLEEKPEVVAPPVESQPPPTNGVKTGEEHEVVNAPERSPAAESSSVSSIPPDMLGDEIVVGTDAQPNGQKPSPKRIVAEPEDTEMGDAESDETVPHYPKRKRASLYNDLDEHKMEITQGGTEEPEARPVVPPKPRQGHGLGTVKGVILGYWRDSPVPQEKNKHAVIGFMDIRDRLRTRIQNTDRRGGAINVRLYPIPPGPGGSWVTFERVVFAEHLVGLDHNQVKEYVKIRTETFREGETDEEQAAADIHAVEEAKRRLELNPPPDTPQPPAIAYGPEIPEDAPRSNRPEAKRRRTGSAMGTIASGSPIMHQAPNQPPPQTHMPQIPLDNLPGQRPTRILVGCWSKSSPSEDSEKHAVYGILGANDMFRVKLVRETMDGRYVEGNFPTGAGALWIAYEEVTFLKHIQHLTRPEMKEYVRVRQYQIDQGETEEEKVANETKAVFEAQQRAAMNPKVAANAGAAARQTILPMERDDNQNSPKAEPGSHELRQSRRDVLPFDNRTPRHAYSEADLRQANRQPSADAVERTNNLARREVTRMENAQIRADRHAANREASGNGNGNGNGNTRGFENRRMFDDNVQRLQKVWTQQETGRIRANPNEDAKMIGGVKYERKQGGPFAGKLVSQGTIISIDGEDYVEYRVLTKPSFF